MEYPKKCTFKVDGLFESEDIDISLYSGVTTFVGGNASGKTRTLKALRDYFKKSIGERKVRYLSSNRIGTMEQYRSQTNYYQASQGDFSLGDVKAKEARQKIETANGDFFTMDDRKDVYIKVAERLSTLFGRNMYIRWNAGKLTVYFEKITGEPEYSVTSEASGLVNLVAILAAIYDEQIEVLLIDEPEVSLHPQLQSYLTREIMSASKAFNKTIILSTHSPQILALKEATDLCNFVFFEENSMPKQISPDLPELKNKQLKEFIIRLSLVYTEGFFAKKILLIEGASDLIVCRFLSNKLELNLDVANSQIIPVEGKGQFQVVTKLFSLIGKEVSVLTDLDGYTDNNNVVDIFCNLPQAKQIAGSQGFDSLQEMIRSIKTKTSELVKTHKEDLKNVYENHHYWHNRDTKSENDNAIHRALVAQLLSVSEKELAAWKCAGDWKHLRERLNKLFEILNSIGCFILRKGTIENYYSTEFQLSDSGKPSIAVNEMSSLSEKPISDIEIQFLDIVSALRYSALTKTVDESYAVKKELLSELALILEILPNVSSEKELLSSVKQAKSNAQSLFTYRIINENERQGVEVVLSTPIIKVSGFPLKAFIGDNVNSIVSINIK